MLAIGGPNHAEEITEDPGQFKTVMVMVNHPTDPLAPQVALPTKYIKRAAEGIMNGKHYRRVIYVHESVTNSEEMSAILANYVLGKWIEEGGELVEEASEVVPSRNDGGAAPVGPQPSRSAGGLYLPG